MASLKFTVRTDLTAIEAALRARGTKAEEAVAQQIRSDTSPFVPALTESLDQRTRVVGNTVIYPGPYARYLYYGKVMVNEATGKGPAKFMGKDGNEVIRFPKGSKLRATDRNLVFNTSVHPQAQSHWFEASKAQNLEKWIRVAEKAVNDG